MSDSLSDSLGCAADTPLPDGEDLARVAFDWLREKAKEPEVHRVMRKAAMAQWPADQPTVTSELVDTMIAAAIAAAIEYMAGETDG